MTDHVRLKTDVTVKFDCDTIMVQFLGYEVWIRPRPGQSVVAELRRWVFNTFRGSPVPIKADADEVLADVLLAVYEHPDFPAWEVHNA